MKSLLLILFTFLSNFCFSQTWNPGTGNVSFKTKMLGIGVEGFFGGLKCNIKFSQNEPQSISASINTNTVNTSNSLRDKHLKEKEEFFQTEIFPVITMQSVSIQKTTDGKYTGTFNVTIKKITKSIKIPFSFEQKSNTGILKSDFIINKNNWNLGGNTPGMADNVLVKINLNLTKI